MVSFRRAIWQWRDVREDAPSGFSISALSELILRYGQAAERLRGLKINPDSIDSPGTESFSILFLVLFFEVFAFVCRAWE